MKIALIIAAGGRGCRSGAAKNKTLHNIRSRPLLYYTLRSFNKVVDIAQRVVICPPAEIATIQKDIVNPFFQDRNITLVSGGDTRQDSIKNGIGKLHPNITHLLIHDGARPNVSHQLLSRVITAIQEGISAVIPVIPVTDTLKVCNKDGNIIKTVDRTHYFMAQTPQAFTRDCYLDALESAKNSGFKATDDASIVEHSGQEVFTIPGCVNNLKVTWPEDFTLAEKLLEPGR